MLRPSASSLATSPSTPVAIATWLALRVGIVTVGAATLAAAFLVVRPDCMVVQRVEARGHQRASEEALRHLADIPNGTTIWGVDLDRAERGVEGHPWVRRARATREWPDRVIIEVEEHDPVALLHYDGLYYVDREGHPFLGDVRDDLDFPVITGVGPDLERAHPDLPRLAVRDALWLLEQLDTQGLVAREDVSEIAFSRTRGFTVQTRGARIAFDVEDLERQVSRLQLLVGRGDLDLGEPRWVDLAPSTVAIVRPLGGPDRR